MSHFYGSIQGARGEATRTGTANSGIKAHVRGWDIGGMVTVENVNGEDVVHFYVTGGSNGHVLERIATFSSRGLQVHNHGQEDFKCASNA